MPLTRTDIERLKSSLTNGVGGLDDLLVRLRKESTTDLWRAEVHRGTVFRGMTEDYLFVDEQSFTTTIAGTSAPVAIGVIPSGAADFPVVLSGSIRYRYLPCAYSFYETVPLSTSGSLFVGSVSGLVTDVYLDGVRLLPSANESVKPGEYYHSVRDSLLILPASGTCKVSYIRRVPGLQQQCPVYSSGTYTIDLPYLPIISTVEVFDHTGTLAHVVSSTGTTVTLDNYLPPGTYAARFYVDRSFCLIPDGEICHILAVSKDAESVTVRFEGEPYLQWKEVVAEDLSPLKTARRNLFVLDREGLPPQQVLARFIPLVSPPFVQAGFPGQEASPIRLQVLVLDKSDEPIYGATCTITASGCTVYAISTNGTIVSTNTSSTNTEGLAYFLIVPTYDALVADLTVAIQVTYSAANLVGSIRIPVVMLNSLPVTPIDDQTPYILRDLFVPTPEADGGYRWYIQFSYVDGTPLPANVLKVITITGNARVVQVSEDNPKDGIYEYKVYPSTGSKVTAVGTVVTQSGDRYTNPITHVFEGGWK